MPPDPAWVTFGGLVAISVLATLTSVTFANAPRRWRRIGNSEDLSNGDEEAISPRYARLNGAAIGIVSGGVAIAALLGATLALASALGDNGLRTAPSLAIAGAAMAAGGAALFGLASTLDLGRMRWARGSLFPIARAAQAVATLPVLRTISAHTNGAPPDAAISHSNVSAAIEQELELLEAAGLSAHSPELRMIRAVLDLDTARVREIMRPRVDMIVAQADSAVDDVAKVMTGHGYSRIPIYEETMDDVVGVVHAQDMLRAGAAGNGPTPRVRDLAREALFVPESQKLEQLLREFQRSRTQIAIVIDEYGGVSGLVTVEDFVEEIVGELVDEFDRDEPEIHRISDVEMMIDARLPLDTLKEEFGVEIEAEGFDTVGGLVYRELGTMPTKGDSVQVDRLKLTVESTLGRRIRRIRVRRMPAPVARAS